MSQIETDHPMLRLVDTQPIPYEGATYLMLRDPLGLTEKTLLVPQPMIPILMLCDGAHTPASIRSTLAIRYGLFLSIQRIEEFLATLDDALLLDNDHSRQARAAVQAEFRQAPFRLPANAGLTYPDDPQELRNLLQGYIDALDGTQAQPRDGTVRGIISPHIDFERGGPVYARVWNQAAESVQSADLAIIFGTDHFSEGHPITLTRQNYATPFGVLPTDTKIVDELADVVGVEAAYAGELHHRREHSIELAAVWMHHIRNGNPIQTVPILTGSVDNSGTQMSGPMLEAFLQVLQQAAQNRRVIVVAAGDLAHVGPAFEGEPVGPDELNALKDADEALINSMCQGDADGFYGAIQQVQDRNNVCGVSPIYLTLRLLAPLQGQNHGYAVCPADVNQTSVVTICGITLK
ncbi:MAG: AmmeMemoRadiSam system protein B [Chloroflexi bacterium]|nr:MAG: AmmeMemoRadiSam system protein B [Chloroflexota bacterium]